MVQSLPQFVTDTILGRFSTLLHHARHRETSIDQQIATSTRPRPRYHEPIRLRRVPALAAYTQPWVGRRNVRASYFLSNVLISLYSGARGTARESNSILSPGPPPGWRTPHKRYISKDRTLLKLLEEPLHSGDREAKYKASALIRQHFHARTTAILVPLNRYLTSLIPTLSHPFLSTPSNPPSSRLPRIASFNRDKFFSSLKTHGSPLPFKSTAKQQEFYQRWIDTNAFSAWLMREEKIVNAILADKVKGT